MDKNVTDMTERRMRQMVDDASLDAYCRLAGIAEEHRKDVLANPLKYLEKAQSTIDHLAGIVRDARDALSPDIETGHKPDEMPRMPETVRIPESEYLRLKACAEIIYNACR